MDGGRLRVVHGLLLSRGRQCVRRQRPFVWIRPLLHGHGLQRLGVAEPGERGGYGRDRIGWDSRQPVWESGDHHFGRLRKRDRDGLRREHHDHRLGMPDGRQLDPQVHAERDGESRRRLPHARYEGQRRRGLPSHQVLDRQEREWNHRRGDRLSVLGRRQRRLECDHLSLHAPVPRRGQLNPDHIRGRHRHGRREPVLRPRELRLPDAL